MIDISSWVAEFPAAAPLCPTHWKSSRSYTINDFESANSDPIDLYIDYPRDDSSARLYAVFLRSFDNRGNKHPQATFMLVEPAEENGTMNMYQRVGIVHAAYDECKGLDFASIANSITPGCTIRFEQDAGVESEGIFRDQDLDGAIRWQRRTLRLV